MGSGLLALHFMRDCLVGMSIFLFMGVATGEMFFFFCAFCAFMDYLEKRIDLDGP